MPSNYKKLGDYIQLVNERNRNLEVETLLGVSIKKILIPSIANTIGTDMSTYKIIKKDQFAYGTVTSRNGDKISIAILKEYDKALVSQIYLVFEVKDETEVLPDYLMMWFRRPEFDRYARYNSHGSARETFDWAEMCETELPIPSLEKQKELVEEYHIVQNRIDLNKKLCEKLEETAQTIYRHWFEDFEFPDENGNPYKSSGGEMVECEELGKEIPVGWRVAELGELCTIKSSKRVFEHEYKNDGVPFYRGKEISQKRNGSIITDIIYIAKSHFKRLVEISGRPLEGDILITAVGTVGNTYMVKDEEFYFKDGNIIWICQFKNLAINAFIYWHMQTSTFENTIEEIMIGSTQKAITINTLSKIKIIIPSEKFLDLFSDLSKSIKNKVDKLSEQVEKLEEMKALLLGKMAVEK